MPPRSTPPVTLPEYERLFRTIHAVLMTGDSDPSRDSLFFAVAGAYLLSHHHKLKSVCPVAGVAAYTLAGPANAALLFGTKDADRFVSDAQHFHCWIEADGWIIDLSAPLFDAMAPEVRGGARIPPFMFQKPVGSPATADSLATPGACLHLPNDRLTTLLLKTFSEENAHADLVRICDQWYARPPRKIAPSIAVEDPAGNATVISLSPLRIEGAW